MVSSGSDGSREVPYTPPGREPRRTGRTAKAVSCGNSHTCAILDDDTLKCWGLNNKYPARVQRSTTRSAPEATAVVNLGAGRTQSKGCFVRGIWHTCAILDNDTLKCWGTNSDYALRTWQSGIRLSQETAVEPGPQGAQQRWYQPLLAITHLHVPFSTTTLSSAGVAITRPDRVRRYNFKHPVSCESWPR